MYRSFKLIASVFFVVLATGCAHSIQMSPPLEGLRATAVENKVDKNVAYYISPVDKVKEVITPGGGGDKVKYYPYKESEAAINTMLSQVFNRVYSISDLNDQAFVSDKNISLIFTPEITTDSYSGSAFTWPPTSFTVTLSCSAVDSSGEKIWTKTVSAEGNAEFDEFKHDFSLSAKRASEQAFQKMLLQIAAAEELK